METVISKDNRVLKNGVSIWYKNGNTIHNAILRIGYHDKRYIIFKTKKNALNSLN